MKQKLINTLLIITSLTLSSFNIFAQNQDIEMADALRADGKIYVVVAVVAVIFAGIIIYLVNLDSKISKLEKSLGKRK